MNDKAFNHVKKVSEWCINHMGMLLQWLIEAQPGNGNPNEYQQIIWEEPIELTERGRKEFPFPLHTSVQSLQQYLVTLMMCIIGNGKEVRTIPGYSCEGFYYKYKRFPKYDEVKLYYRNKPMCYSVARNSEVGRYVIAGAFRWEFNVEDKRKK